MILLLLLYIYGLAVFGYYLSLTTVPSMYVLQIDYNGVDDRIVKTVKSLDEFETIYSNPSIIDFTANSTNLLVTTGELNATTELTIIQFKNNTQQKIDIGNKYISSMHSAKDQFIVEYDSLKLEGGIRDYINLLGIVDPNNLSLQELNPNLLATGVSNVYVNPSGNMLAFNGVANKQYILNLDNQSSVSILNSLSEQSTGFIDDNSLGYITNNYNENAKLAVLNLETNQESSLDLDIKYASEVVANKTLDTVYISQLEKSTSNNFADGDYEQTGTQNTTGQSYTTPQYSNINMPYTPPRFQQPAKSEVNTGINSENYHQSMNNDLPRRQLNSPSYNQNPQPSLQSPQNQQPQPNQAYTQNQVEPPQRNNPSQFEPQSQLDVPAFIRKKLNQNNDQDNQ